MIYNHTVVLTNDIQSYLYIVFLTYSITTRKYMEPYNESLNVKLKFLLQMICIFSEVT